MSEKKLTPKEEAEQEDKKLLAENAGKLQDIMQLILDGNTRRVAKERVCEAKGKMAGKRRADSGMVFHLHQGKRAAVTQTNSETLALGDALEGMIQTSRYGADLQAALQRVAKQRVEILERQLGRF